MPDINDGERQADLDWLYGDSPRPTPPPPVVAPRRVAPETPATTYDPPASPGPAHRGATQADFDWLYKTGSAAEPVAPAPAPAWPVTPPARPVAPAAQPVAPAVPLFQPVAPAFQHVAPTFQPVAPIAPPVAPAAPFQPVAPAAPAASGEFDDYGYDESDDYYDDYADEEPLSPAKPKAHSESRRRKVLRRTLTVFLVIMALLVSVAGFYLWRLTSTMCSVTNGEHCNAGSVISVLGNLGNGNDQNLVPLKTDANGRTNVLMMGTSDDRTDGAGGDWLTDSIIVVSLSQTDKNVFMISIPRDLWVKYPTGCYWGSQGKVNEVFSCKQLSKKTTQAQFQAALTATIPTFEQITGLSIQYAVDLNYGVLESLTNAVGGGIYVDLYPSDKRGIYDVNTGLKLAPNTVRCKGDSITPMHCGLSTDLVMALARARNGDGGYGLSGGNFSREQNQQAIIVGLLNQAKENGIITNLAGVNTALQGFGDNLRSTVPANEIPTVVALAQQLQSSSFKSLDFVNAKPALLMSADMGGQAALVPAAGLYNYYNIQKWIAKQMSADPAVLEGASIDVLNASGTPGKATTAATALANLGFTIGKVDSYKTTVTGTQVYDITGTKPQTSAALAKQFGVTVASGPPDSYKAASNTDFVVLIGA